MLCCDFLQGPSVGVKEAAASALSSAASAIGASTGSAAAAQASKVTDTEDLKRLCAVYRDLATSCARSYVTLSLLACVGDDCLEGGPFFDTALLGEVRMGRQTGRVAPIQHDVFCLLACFRW